MRNFRIIPMVIFVIVLLVQNIYADNISLLDVLNESNAHFIYFRAEIISSMDTKEIVTCSDEDKISRFFTLLNTLPVEAEEKSKEYLCFELKGDSNTVRYSSQNGFEVITDNEARNIYCFLDVYKVINMLNEIGITRWYNMAVMEPGTILPIDTNDIIDKCNVKFQINSPIFFVNGTQKQIDETNKNVVPFIDEKADRTLVPLRAIGEASGYAVEWKADEQKVILEQNDKQIELRIGESNITVRNGDDATKVVETDCVPVIVESRIFLPIRIVAELMEYEVDWKEATKEIILQRK